MKRFSTLLLSLLCVCMAAVAAPWYPNETYATFCDNFQIDHVFLFYNDGAWNNTWNDANVQTAPCQGIIAFSLMTWDRQVLAESTNYAMKEVSVYLKADGQYDMLLTKIKFSDAGKGSNNEKGYNNETNFNDATAYSGCHTYFLQKRQYPEKDDGCQFSYFNIAYGKDVYNYIQNNKNRNLSIRLKGTWYGVGFDYSSRLESWDIDGIADPVTDPVIDNFQWTKNSAGQTVLQFTASEMFSSIYHERAVVNGKAEKTETTIDTRSGFENRTRTDVASLTVNQLNLMGQDNSPYYLQVARQPKTDINSSHYNTTYGGPKVSHSGPQTDWKKIDVPMLYLPQNINLSNNGTDTIYAAFTIPRKPLGRVEDESDIIIEYSTDENFSSFETVRESFNLANRLQATAYNVALPLPQRMLNQGRKTFYVRFSRDFVNHSTTCSKAQILLNTNRRRLSAVEAQDVGGAIEVTWSSVGDDNGLWTAGMFYRVKYVVDGTTYTQDFPNRNTTKATLTAGIPTCVPLTYTVQICTDVNVFSELNSNEITMSPNRQAVITSLTATKGDSNNRVRLQWTVPKDGNDFSYFAITRAERGDTVAVTLVPQMPMNTSMTTFIYEDNSMKLGTYYNYTVTGYRECNGSIDPMSSLTETGFALPYGVITGQITYDGRQGVPGVKVTAYTDEEVPFPKKVVSDTTWDVKNYNFRTLKPYDTNNIQGPAFTSNYGTAMFWIRVQTDDIDGRTRIFCVQNNFEISLLKTGKMQVEHSGINYLQSPDALTQNEWYHVAVSFAPNSFTLYLNGNEVDKKVFIPTKSEIFSIGRGRGNPYRCYEIADVRLYNYCMDSAEIHTTALQIPLKGDEPGLELYYSACEEGDEVHDLSGHGRDLKIANLQFNNITDTINIPKQVTFRTENDSTRANYTAYTKSDGTYVITGIPYRDEGTYYKVIPTLGTHEFAPANRPLYFNNNTNTHNNTNFTDMTSVQVSGAIYYEGTDYPVEGALLSVDGVACVVGGVPVTTDKDGKFTILVPMGDHYITATKNGHTFAYGGRYPEDPNSVGTTNEFMHDITDLTFYDNTKLLLVGRVAGGDDEMHKPHGMNLGKATIGRAVITLQASEIYSLNTDSVERVWEQPTDSIVASGRVLTDAFGTDNSHNVVIYTDSLTGEYTALLPPLTYKVKSIVIPSNDDYRFNPLEYNPIELGAYAGQAMMQDSLKIDSTRVRRVNYHLAFDAPYYAAPVLTVTDAARTDLAFGEEWLTWQDEKEKVHMVPSFTVDSVTGKPDYRMTYPLFRQGTAYHWRLKITETYINKDNAEQPVTTVLPWKNGIVTIKNEIGNRVAAERDTIVAAKGDSTEMLNYGKGATIALAENQIALDSLGTALYTFRASAPNITAPYTLGCDMSYTNVYGTRNYGWMENGQFYGVVLGSITNGSDILTNGPDDVLYILRNAPGANSTVSATSGTTFTRTSNSSTAANWMGMANFQFGVGKSTLTFEIPTLDNGMPDPEFPIGLVSTLMMGEKLHIDPGAFYMGSKSWAKTSTSVNTLTQTVSTTPGTEGSDGDVFVGQATNDVFSNSRRVDIQRDPNDSTRYYIGAFDGFVMGKHFGTQFVYTQSHIEDKLIPDFIRARNALLEHVDQATYDRFTIQQDSSVFVNTTDKMRYFTPLTPDNPNFGKDSTYVAIDPQIEADGELHVEKDMVMHYNDQIKTWKQLLEHNEKMKVLCQQRSGEFKKEQYEAAVEKVNRVREVMSTLQEARDKMAAVKQYNVDSLKAFDKRTSFGDGAMYMGFSKGEVQRLIKIYNDNEKIEKEQLKLFEKEGLDSTRTNISEYYGGGYLMRNISLSPGASVALGNTKALSHGENVTTSHNADVSIGVGLAAKTRLANFSFSFTADAGVGLNASDGTDNNESFATNITLSSNATSSMSFDMYASPDGFGPIFFVRGGATSCPYVGEERTKYYEPGRYVLGTATAAIEKPRLYLRQGSSSMQNDLPVGSSAYFTLGITNQTAVSGALASFKLRPVDKHTGEALGAVLEVNGTPLTSDGISYSITGGDSVFVSLRVYQSNPEIMRYDSIGLELVSACDPLVRTQLWLSVSYRYSCSDINLSIDNTLLNTQMKSILRKDTVELAGEISGLLPNYSALYGVRLQYKRGEGEWSTLRTWRKGITERDNEGNYPMPNTEHFRFSIPMPDKDYADGTYQVRAVTVCKPAAEEEVCKESETFTVIKDVVRPEPISAPTPVDGILSAGNEISVTFTKDIQPTRVLETNISVSGELNGHDLRHSVGLQLGGQTAATQATLRLGASDFTIETWLNYSEAGELLNIGGDKFRMSINDGGNLVVQIDTVTYTTTAALPKDKWLFLALSYARATTGNVLNASMAYDATTETLLTDEPVATVNTKAELQLGGGTAIATMHDLTIWSVARNMVTSLSERSRAKLPSIPGLVAYWPLDDGYGKVATERVHARHLAVGDNAWWIAGDNYAVVLDGNTTLRIPVSEVGIDEYDDYVLDCWVNATTDGTILSVGDSAIIFAVENNQLAITINRLTRKITPFALGTWHYLALNVRRSGSTSVLLDENVVLQYIDGYTTPRLGDYLTIGQGLTGAFDELRIAKATMTNELLMLSSHFRLNGNETGLVAYYPFEKDSIDSGNQHQTAPTLENRCANSLNKQSAQWMINGQINDQMVNDQMVNNNHPALVEARPVESVPFTFTASDRQINIAIDDKLIDPARVEGCNLRVEVKNVIDENNNYSAPICWNVYVRRNTLLWEDGYASVVKKELEEQEFALTILNTGSEMQTWELSNIPAWLQLSATSGVIAPLSELTLTATLPASMAAGYYADILLLTGNNGIAEPCLIEAMVVAEEPDWKVNESAYESTGNIIARLSLPAGVAQSEYDIVAAFTDGECVGIAHPQYISNYDAWYVMMTVYGNANSKTNMQFRLWNAESGITYASVKVQPKAFRFSPNMVQGTLAEPVVLEVTNRLQQTLSLQPAWNWISLNVKPVSAKTEKVFEPILGDISEVKSKSQLFTVNAADTTYGGTLKSMSVTPSYRVNALREATLLIEGTAIDCANTPLTIRKGWNWIGYLPLQTMSLADALADIEPVAGDLIKSKTAFAVYDGSEWVGTLTRMTSGEGYMYKSNATDAFTFRYPEVSVLRMPQRKAKWQINEQMVDDEMVNVFEPVTDPYSGNMSIIARVMNGTEPVHGVEVGVFAGDECRGAATEEFVTRDATGDATRDADGSSAIDSENGYWFLTIAGDEPTPLTIKVYDPATGETILVEQTLNYTDDATLGTLSEPYIIQLQVNTGLESLTSDFEQVGATKFIRDGIVYILRDGKLYTAQGQEINAVLGQELK